jgi:hypothetical protein
MYKLSELDKFNIKNLLKIKQPSFSNTQVTRALNEILKMTNNDLADYIYTIINLCDSEILIMRTTEEDKAIDYCRKLVVKLFESTNGEEEIKTDYKIKELSNIHPEIYSHIQRFFNT